MMEHVEVIYDRERPIVYIVRADLLPGYTSFITPSDTNMQLGFVVYPAGGEIAAHVHVPIERNIFGTAELLVLKKGRCLIDVYNDDRERLTTRELRAGDIMLMLGGGHGFRILEDTVFVEVKQGPYTGLVEKERFS